MAARPDSAARDLVDPDEADTLADGEWPVAEQYRVEPADIEDADTTAATEQAHARPLRPSRFPPEVPRGLVAALGALLLLILGGLLAAAFLGGADEPQAAAPSTASVETTDTAPSRPSPSVTQGVPNAVGVPLGEARTLLEAAGFRVRVEMEASERPDREVLRQTPAAGTEAQRTAVVTLTVAEGVERIVVPDVDGAQVDDAVRALRRAGLRPEIRRVRSDEPGGTVLEQAPAADEAVGRDTIVRLEVARSAPEPATVDAPDMVGLPVADARARLQELGLRVAVTRVASSEPSGTVIRQTPAAGVELRDGATVRLHVSSGPAPVSVPDVTGLDEPTARQQLQAAGFTVEAVDEPTDDPARDGLVLAQDPAGGSRSEQGALVTLTVARLG